MERSFQITTNRKAFQGVWNILSFNRHFYIYGLLALGGILVGLSIVKAPNYLSLITVIGFAFGLLMPLLISAYVYDFAGYYQLKWLKDMQLPASTNSIVNIHAGFDETSHLIEQLFPNSQLHILDFYDASKHTEMAIVRARYASVNKTFTPIKTDKIPMADNSADVLFMLSAVHEIRDHEEKIIFLKEVHRILKSGGKAILVEHLRDLPNFLAFTIGFTHFFSKQTWKMCFEKSGLLLHSERKFTPFMSVFELGK